MLHREVKETSNSSSQNITTSIENDLQNEIKKLAIDLERRFNDIIEEALRDLLKKYQNKSR